MASINNSDIFQVALRRRWHLLAIVGVAVLLAFVFSGETFIKPKFKSTAVVYPVNIIPYSMESPTEQLLQLFHSADVRTLMVKRFNLAKHYNIESNTSAALTKLNNTYDENILVRKTEFESIKIDITDINPDTASAMVNGLVDCVDKKARLLQREKTKEVVKIFRDQLDVKQKQIDSLETINNLLRVRYGLLDYKSQAKEATKSYLKLVSGGASKDKLREVDSMLRNLEEKGGAQIAVTDQLKSLRESYNGIKSDYDRAISDLTKELTYSNVITKPFPADSKCYPVRSLIVIVSAFSGLLLGLLIFVILDRRPKSNAGADQT
jgi:capsular polysaccharide biosynthesis protein